MTSVQGRAYPHRERPFVAILDFSLPLESVDKLFNQPVGSPGPHLVVIPTVAPFVPKYTEKNLQKIFKTVLEAQALTTSKKH